jgi:hypothetical protein
MEPLPGVKNSADPENSMGQVSLQTEFWIFIRFVPIRIQSKILMLIRMQDTPEQDFSSFDH